MRVAPLQQYSIFQAGLTKPENMQFLQANAKILKPIYTGYDMVLAVNLLKELYTPDRFLASIDKRLNKK